jgi:serine phosphatase RsbU (regulator of sigma subunit)/anti-sigma regulatory factor (Ser/Thr protein kinase)
MAVEGEARPTDTERLRRIEAVTDAALAHLDVDELLPELLERVREILEADTAAVLLLDPEGRDLVATSASGLEEVRQGVRIPLGEGFAGRIAAEAAPLVIEDVLDAKVLNPSLHETGIRSLLGAPLVAQGRVTGVIHVGSLTTREFGSEDIELLQLVADRVALAVDSRRSNVDRAAAAALQRSLIPARLPVVPGLELSGRYLPDDARGVGGDWYDVFTLPSGHVGVVIGDVVGRGLGAAIVMGRLRSALRAYALETLDPGEVLRRLDRKIQHFETGQMTTVLYCVIDHTLATMEISSAGHLLPVMAVPGAAAATIEAAVDPPLGVAPALDRRRTTVELTPGAEVVLFTDGLVERRGEPLDRGFERLRALLGTESAERTCATIITKLTGDTGRHDDVAVLVLRRYESTGDQPLHLEAPALSTSLAPIRAALRRWLASTEVSDTQAIDVLLAVSEATANVVRHAYGPGGDRSGGDTVKLDVAYSALPTPEIVATVADTGDWRLPWAENPGRGMLIMERCADEVAVDRTAHGTEVRLRFRLGQTRRA